MATKGFMDAAAEGAQDIYSQLAEGNKLPKKQQAAQDVKATKDAKDAPRMERLNLKIPAEIKEYLQVRAYEESSAKHTVSLTEYLCDLVRADMEKHK